MDEETKKPREPILWDCCEDNEIIAYRDPNDAIEYWLDDLLTPHMTPEQVIEALPETVDLYGFARMVPTPQDCGYPLEHVLGALDEEYGCPDGPDDPTPRDARSRRELRRGSARRVHAVGLRAR